MGNRRAEAHDRADRRDISSADKRVHYVYLTLPIQALRYKSSSDSNSSTSTQLQAASCTGHSQKLRRAKKWEDDEECGWWRRHVVNVGAVRWRGAEPHWLDRRVWHCSQPQKRRPLWLDRDPVSFPQWDAEDDAQRPPRLNQRCRDRRCGSDRFVAEPSATRRSGTLSTSRFLEQRRD